MYSIQFKDVSKTYGDTPATDSLSFNVQKGEIYGILGPNGAGKTTIIRQIMGLTAPDKGEITVLGMNPQNDWKKIRSKVGLVSQDTLLYPELSGRMNLEFQAALFLNTMKGVKQKINEILKLVDLSSRADDRVSAYSGGMKRRLAIGRALLHNPEILFLDEPTLGVDVQGTHKIWDYIKMLSESGKTILLTTNVMSEADYLCHRLLIIDYGKKITEGTPEELKKALGANKIIISLEKDIADDLLSCCIPVPYTRNGSIVSIVTETGTDDLIRIIQQLPENISVAGIEMKKPVLDDVFLHYTGHSLRD